MMNKEIKERIETINKGEVPDGYKRTRYIGIAPKDWTLGKLSDVIANKQRPVPKPDKPYWRLGIKSWAKGTLHIFVENPDKVNMEELYVVHENDLIVNITFAWEHAIAIAKKDDEGLLVSHRFPTYEFKKNQIPEFYKAVISQQYFKEMLENISPGGAGRNRVLNKKDFLNLPCYIPPVKEQEKIAEIISRCDTVIEECEKQVEEYKNLKKTCLSKMFPKKGSNVPEIRFPGFTDAWEQRKLGDLLSLLKDGTHGTHKDSDEGVFLLSAKNIKNGKVFIDENTDRRISKQEFDSIHSNFRLQENDVLLTIVGSIGEVAILENPDIMTFQRSVAFLRPKDILSSTFLKTELETGYFQNELSDRKSQSAQPGVYLGELEKIPFILPNVEEQQQIGAYFRNLDHLITLHHHKADAYRQMKKALMQLLLTGIVRVKL